MKEKLIAEQNKILEIVTGSYLYGTNTETSDKDYIGIFLPSEEYILGFKTVEEVDFSVKDKTEEGKNTEKAVDKKLYEFRKFIKLALECNPNIIEILFVNEQNIVFINEVGKELLSLKYLFPYKGLKQKFLGYSYAQRHKMVIKKDNYFDLQNGLSYLNTQNYGKTLLEIVFQGNCPYFIKKQLDKNENISFIQVGDLNFMPSTIVKVAKHKLEERIAKVGNREELLTKYGWDTKFGSHLIRLMLEGIELLKTGNLVFPLKEAEMLKDIRAGKWEMVKVLDYSYELEKEVESLVESSKLPSKPNIKEIEEFTIKILRKIIKIK
jgi:predicted nucleotidyltransferase